jgi:hypothetical protein
MSKNFSFMLASDDSYSTEALKQGDILERNDALKSAIGIAHQYYANEPDYDYFVVLTPTCDLVLRDGKCKSRYISLAAVRPLSVLVERELEKYKRSVKVPGLFCNLERKDRAVQFVERLLHNTEEGYLFLPGEFFSDGTDRCAFLRLSVALRASEHYDACVSSKFKQLAIDFSAKVGQLTANLYGQVATQALDEQADIDPKQIKDDYKSRLLDSDKIYWLSTEQERAFKVKSTAAKAENGGEIDAEKVKEIFRSIPSDRELLADRLIHIAAEAGLNDPNLTVIFRNLILSDTVVGRFLKK